MGRRFHRRGTRGCNLLIIDGRPLNGPDTLYHSMPPQQARGQWNIPKHRSGQPILGQNEVGEARRNSQQHAWPEALIFWNSRYLPIQDSQDDDVKLTSWQEKVVEKRMLELLPEDLKKTLEIRPSSSFQQSRFESLQHQGTKDAPRTKCRRRSGGI